MNAFMSTTSSTVFEHVRRAVLDMFTNPETWGQILIVLVKIIVIWIVGRLSVKAVNKTVQLTIQQREKRPDHHDLRRSRTITRLAGNTITYVINFIVILLILSHLGFHLLPVLAGAGVLGLAIGFGAQNLVRDMITGFFILFEDQFAVGDVIQTGSYKGTVEELGLRMTKIRSWTGEVHIIPNGSITAVTNFSVYNTLGVIDVTVDYETDLKQTMEVVSSALLKLYHTTPEMVQEPAVLGIQELGAAEVIIRITYECRPNTQQEVARIMMEAIKQTTDEMGIKTKVRSV